MYWIKDPVIYCLGGKIRPGPNFGKYVAGDSPRAGHREMSADLARDASARHVTPANEGATSASARPIRGQRFPGELVAPGRWIGAVSERTLLEKDHSYKTKNILVKENTKKPK